MAQEDRYGPVLSSQGRSPVLKAIWRGVYGPDYPEEVEPFGFLTRTELRHILAELRIDPGSRLADLGCGRGGPGLWIARQTSAYLVGLDIAAEAPVEARHRIGSFGLGGRAGFLAADCSRIPLRTGAFDAAMSVDALWMILDKMGAVREIARILRPGARLVFTTWQPTYLNYADLLRSAGFGDSAVVASGLARPAVGRLPRNREKRGSARDGVGQGCRRRCAH
jgi:SAM-dependent methyltransferase